MLLSVLVSLNGDMISWPFPFLHLTPSHNVPPPEQVHTHHAHLHTCTDTTKTAVARSSKPTPVRGVRPQPFSLLLGSQSGVPPTLVSGPLFVHDSILGKGKLYDVYLIHYELENIISTSVSWILLLWMKLSYFKKSQENRKWIKVQVFWGCDQIHKGISCMTLSFGILPLSIGERDFTAHKQLADWAEAELEMQDSFSR